MSRYVEIDDVFHALVESHCAMPNIKKMQEVFDSVPTADVVENKVLRLLIDWAIECGFGYDSIPNEYEKYKNDIQNMSYTDGLIYIAMKEVEYGEIH